MKEETQLWMGSPKKEFLNLLQTPKWRRKSPFVLSSPGAPECTLWWSLGLDNGVFVDLMFCFGPGMGKDKRLSLCLSL